MLKSPAQYLVNCIIPTEKVLSKLGFRVRDLDAELEEGEPRREDLRLYLDTDPDWVAIVEVKGYSNGTKTNDSRQIREHRERFVKEEGRPPDLTLWIANTFYERDPSTRPAPDQNVNEAAENVGAVHVLATDLFKCWAQAARENTDVAKIVECLRNAPPGLWIPANHPR